MDEERSLLKWSWNKVEIVEFKRNKGLKNWLLNEKFDRENYKIDDELFGIWMNFWVYVEFVQSLNWIEESTSSTAQVTCFLTFQNIICLSY